MSLSTAAKFAKRELRGGLKGFRIFLACLALGVAAIAAVGSVRSGIQEGLAREGAAILGGDAELEFTYRFATPEERSWMNTNAKAVSETTDFRSMATVGDERALTQIKSIDTAYPLVGRVELTPDMPLAKALADNGGVMEQILIDRLGLDIGDTFKLGSKDFTLRAALTREPDGASNGFMLGPRTIVYTDALKEAALLSAGSIYSTKYRLVLEEGADLAAIEALAETQFENSGVRWTDSRNGAPGVAQFVERLGAFLVLVGLSGLAVGGVGVSAAVRSYLSDKTSVIATLRTLGADRSTIFQTYFIQVGVLSLLGIAIGLALGALVPAALAPLIEARLPIPAEIGIFPRPLFEAAIYGVLTAFVFTMWPLARAENVRAATLFRDALDSSSAFPAPKYIAFTALGLTMLIGCAALFSGTWQLTLAMAGGITGALLLLAGAAFLIRWASRRGARYAKGRPALRWALSSISGPREGAVSVVLSLGLGLSVLAAVGQIDGNLRNAITDNLPDTAPSYFFVDLQPDQMPGYLERLENDPAVSRIDSAPMLRGVITKINDIPAREYSGEHWVIQGDRAVTYAESPSANTNIVEGKWWEADYTGPPQISFAAEEAEEMGLKLSDTVTINVLGRDITGTITSFREVDFSGAEMGFILTMNPSALRGAPHTFLSSVYAEEEAEAQILRDLSNQFPNITAIRLRDALDRAADLLGSIAAATSYGAAATLITGFLVLIGAAAAGTKSRTYEAAVLKTLGASRGRILRSFALRAALLGFVAGAVALAAGLAGGWAVLVLQMDSSFRVIWPNAIGIILGGVLATLVAGLAFAWGPLAARPAQVLRAKE